MKNLEVNYAVIPAAGKGLRFLPITKGVAKEMLPIVDKPTIDYIVEECLDAGIKNIIFIVNDEKKEIEKYYKEDKNLLSSLYESKKFDSYKEIKELTSKANFYYVIQKEQLGLGHAVYLAKDIIKDNNFVVCCGDDIVLYDLDSPVKEMVNAFKKVNGKTIVGGQKVKLEEIVKYASMDVETQIDENTYKIKGIKEKPKLEEVKSPLASLGKWVLTSEIFNELKDLKKGVNGEIQLTDAIASLILKDEVYFYNFKGTRYDCGSKIGYIKAIIDVSLSRDDLKEEIKDYILNIKDNI